MDSNGFPPGWNEDRIKRVAAFYENQTEQEALAEDIDRMIAEGLADFERGDVVDGEEAFRRLRSHSVERRRGK